MSKTTVIASSDVAFIKYWGRKDEVLRLPENGSISMKLANLTTTTTIEFLPDLKEDEITINGEQEAGEASRVVKHLDRIRELAGVSTKAKMVSNNSFPTGSGLSSSGSGFAALTLAATQALELSLSEQQASILARQGSGTACRCVCGGFVEWLDGDTSESSYSQTIFPADHWELRDLIAVASYDRKAIPTSAAQQTAGTSPLFVPRQKSLRQRTLDVKTALADRDFTRLGTLLEQEALEFHSVLLTSQPPYIAWYPGSVAVMHRVQGLRQAGIECYFTINTGHNVHVLTLPEFEADVHAALSELAEVKEVIASGVGAAPTTSEYHLF